MEIILSKEVANLGFKDDVVIVKNGYGRNYLIPKSLGVLATDSAKKVLAENLKQRAFKEQKEVDDANKIASKSFAKQGQAIEKKFISITGGSVKALGKYTAAVRLHRSVVVDITFEVIAE